MAMVFGLTGYLANRLDTIYTTRENTYTKRDLTYTDDQVGEIDVTLGKFNNSLNFVFGLTGLPEGFDILNNPYVEIIGYEYKEYSLT